MVLLWALGASQQAMADEFSWDATAKPEVLCKSVLNNMRFFYVTSMNAPDTYQEVKAYMHETLTGKGEKEARLMALYDGLLPKLEAGDFKPPAVENLIDGRHKMQSMAQEACSKSFP